MATFHLPDLGEGLAEAEILAWHVKPGDLVKADQPMVSVETAKAVVEVPVPFDGTVTALHGAVGDVVATGAPLVDFDSGTVVGHMPTPTRELPPATPAGARPGTPAAAGARTARARALPLARGLARHLGLDLEKVHGSGADGAILIGDVLAARDALGAHDAARESGARASEARPLALEHPPAGARVEPLRGPRRAMAQSMTHAHRDIPLSTVCDDADVEDWPARADFTSRLLRAVVAGCRAEPSLNAWYDAARQTRVLLEHVDVALAVDTPDGLIVPVVRQVQRLDGAALRAEVARVKQAARARTASPEELRGFTVMLSNFGSLAGRYGTPMVIAPAVALLGAGKVRAEPVVRGGRIEARRRLPLSLSFDHRCVTGGEACRFLAAAIADLQRPD
jgi:2-oxoisovalerate dehydrogenase E2 component (dihydrolipoyl transacylase)